MTALMTVARALEAVAERLLLLEAIAAAQGERLAALDPSFDPAAVRTEAARQMTAKKLARIGR